MSGFVVSSMKKIKIKTDIQAKQNKKVRVDFGHTLNLSSSSLKWSQKNGTYTGIGLK